MLAGSRRLRHLALCCVLCIPLVDHEVPLWITGCLLHALSSQSSIFPFRKSLPNPFFAVPFASSGELKIPILLQNQREPKHPRQQHDIYRGELFAEKVGTFLCWCHGLDEGLKVREKRFAVHLNLLRFLGLKERIERGAYFLGYIIRPDSGSGPFHRGWREET